MTKLTQNRAIKQAKTTKEAKVHLDKNHMKNTTKQGQKVGAFIY